MAPTAIFVTPAAMGMASNVQRRRAALDKTKPVALVAHELSPIVAFIAATVSIGAGGSYFIGKVRHVFNSCSVTHSAPPAPTWIRLTRRAVKFSLYKI